MGRTADVTFLSQTDERSHQARDLTLFYVVQGSAQIVTKEHTYSLNHEDLLAVNPGERYTLIIRSGVTARIIFRHEEVYAILQGELRQVRCCSVHILDGSYNVLRFQIQALLDTLLQEKFGRLAFEKQSCGLLLTLLSEYSIPGSTMTRKQEVEQWIENVSREPVSLEDAAAQFHLTPPYFSAWFSSAFECTFLKYLSRIRCQKAQAQLLNSDASILRIAMDQGFPNAVSFTKAFTLQFGVTPLQYRNSHANHQRDGVLAPQEVAPYLKREKENSQQRIQQLTIECRGFHERLNPYWNQLCCLGALSQLADLEVQTQVQQLQRQFRFRYARLLLRRGSGFFREDKAMSFLFELELTPFYVVDFHDAAEEGYLDWLRELFHHLSFRFGMRNFHVEILLDGAFDRGEAAEFRKLANTIRGMLRTLRSECVLYGPGLRLSSDGGNLAACLRAKPDLDHITIRCAPVGILREAGLQVRKIPESDYLLQQYRLGQSIAKEHGWKNPLLITGWRTSLGPSNVLNDSSWMAARIIQTALTGYGELPSLPLECPLEVLGDTSHPSAILQGREGLMTLNGLPKPAFYALRFLKHLDDYYLYHNPHIIATTSIDGYLQIVLQNSAPLSHQYYLHDEKVLSRQLPIPHTFYESLNPYQVCLRLTGVPDGSWMMKTRIVNDSVGNLFQGWLELNYPDESFMGRDELSLLRAKAQPEIQGNTLTSRNGVLEVPVQMAANEIRHIHLLPIH